MAKGKGGSTSPATAARRHHTSIWGKPGPSCDTPQCTPGLFLCPAAMLRGAGSLELGRDISMSTPVPVTADSSVMTPLQTIMTDNCLMRSGLFHKKIILSMKHEGILALNLCCFSQAHLGG